MIVEIVLCDRDHDILCGVEERDAYPTMVHALDLVRVYVTALHSLVHSAVVSKRAFTCIVILLFRSLISLGMVPSERWRGPHCTLFCKELRIECILFAASLEYNYLHGVRRVWMTLFDNTPQPDGNSKKKRLAKYVQPRLILMRLDLGEYAVQGTPATPLATAIQPRRPE